MSLFSFFDTLRRSVRWLCRFRHRCGYGIHSPYAFSFVTGVVYEREAYYAYAPLHDERRGLPSERRARGRLREKDDRLLFRLANAARAKRIAVVGQDTALSERYLSAACPSARLTHFDALPQPAHLCADAPDLLYIAADALAADATFADVLRAYAANAPQGALLVVHGIHATRAHFAAWQSVAAHNNLRLAFDLYDFGIGVFEPRLNREAFVINYF